MQLRTRRRALVPLAFTAAVLIGLLAIPALAADPSGSPGAPTAASPAPDGNAKPGKGPKANKAPSVAVTMNGTVGTRTDAEGRAEYTLNTGTTVLVLDAGPAWFYKDAHPLKAYVGKRVAIVGEQRQGSVEVDVQTVDGKAIREPGKPPWAGGWKRVGKDHPGWSQEKADRWAAKQAEKKARFGLDCWPPGQCKDASGKPQTPAASPSS
jgi:hypothetical protein